MQKAILGLELIIIFPFRYDLGLKFWSLGFYQLAAQALIWESMNLARGGRTWVN